MSYDGHTICIEGVILDAPQKKVVLPILKQHHAGELTHHELIVRSRQALEKAGVPLIFKNEEADY